LHQIQIVGVNNCYARFPTLSRFSGEIPSHHKRQRDLAVKGLKDSLLAMERESGMSLNQKRIISYVMRVMDDALKNPQKAMATARAKDKDK
jgi:hypothetical protein